MFKQIVISGCLLVLVLAAVACGNSGGNSSEAANSTSTGSTKATLNDDYTDALPVPSQLAIGTLLLEDTDDAVTEEQAGKLLPNWQMLQALQSSGTAAPAELDAVLKQIQGAMTDEQLVTIKEMELTLDNMTELIQEHGLQGRGFAGGGGGGSGGFQPPAGVNPGGRGGPGGGGFGGTFGGGGNQNPEEQQAVIQERLNRFAGTAMTSMLVSLLEARAKGETLEIAAPNPDFILQRTLFAAVVEATGLDQREIGTQSQEGKTILEIAQANGADVDEIVAQVVAAETERVNQAVADGNLEQTDADQWLADLKTRVTQMLEQPLQFGGRGSQGRGSQGDDSGQP